MDSSISIPVSDSSVGSGIGVGVSGLSTSVHPIINRVQIPIHARRFTIFSSCMYVKVNDN